MLSITLRTVDWWFPFSLMHKGTQVNFKEWEAMFYCSSKHLHVKENVPPTGVD